MDRALVIGESGGIGGAVCVALRLDGVSVTGLSRSSHGLDLMDEMSVVTTLERLEGSFDLILVATGALEIGGSFPEKALRQVTARTLADQFALNCIGPSLVLKHSVRLMPRDRRSVFAALSARVGSIGDNAKGGWYGYRTAKAALNQMIHTAAIELARSHVASVCVAIHPGTVRTPLTAKYLGRHAAVAPEDAAKNLLRVINGLGPEDTGQFFDWKGNRVPW